MQSLVSLSAFPKSGVTYLSFLLFYSLFPDDCDVHDLERKYIIDIHAHPNGAFALPSNLHLYKSHFPYIANQPVIRRTSKTIYLIRHPIDVMMSAWDFERLTGTKNRTPQSPSFRAFVRRWIGTGGTAFPQFGSWVAHVRSWLSQSAIPVHLVTYENLVDKPAGELDAILKFVGAEVPERQRLAAIERSSMKSMAALEEHEIKMKIEGVFYSDRVAEGYGLGRRFINKGYRDSYRHVLTDEERAITDHTFGFEIQTYFARR